MAKSKQKNIAIGLRRKGKSIKDIAKKLGIAKSTVSFWCKDIELTPEQIEKLQKRMATKGSYENRLKGARVQHERRLKQIEELQEKGFNLIKKLSREEILLIGAALYWGEGTKKEGRAKLINSDLRMVKFIINWFQYIWGIPKSQLTLQVLINKVHEGRVEEVEEFWSYMLGIPRNQFTKTTLVKRRNRKKYSNFSNHYGTVTVSVRRGSDLRHIINGLITGIIEKSIFDKKPA